MPWWGTEPRSTNSSDVRLELVAQWASPDDFVRTRSESLGHEVIVANTRELRANTGRDHKSDPHDAQKLSIVWAITHTRLLQRAAEDARRKSEEELSQSQATVRMLSDLLPICAWCKKIRNEAGAWEDLETYILGHSQAKFTHGVCEACVVRFSGDFGR